MANKKVLVLGAGIMASHMVPYLAESIARGLFSAQSGSENADYIPLGSAVK